MKRNLKFETFLSAPAGAYLAGTDREQTYHHMVDGK